MLYRFARWQSRRRNNISGFIFDDVTLLRRSTSIRKPNFIDIFHGLKKTTVLHTGILLPVSVSIISSQSACHSAPVCQISFTQDHPQQKKMISAIFNFRSPIISSQQSPTSYRQSIETIALNCLVFEKIAFSFTHFGDRQTDGQTNRWKALTPHYAGSPVTSLAAGATTRHFERIKPLSLSRAAVTAAIPTMWYVHRKLLNKMCEQTDRQTDILTNEAD